MSFNYQGSMKNHARASRIARELIKPLDASDIEWLIHESLSLRQGELERLYTAVDTDYPNLKKELANIQDEHADQRSRLEDISQTAWFILGWQAAIRLMGG